MYDDTLILTDIFLFINVCFVLQLTFSTSFFYLKSLASTNRQICLYNNNLFFLNIYTNIYPSLRFCACAPARNSSPSSWTCSSSLWASVIWLYRTLVIECDGVACATQPKMTFVLFRLVYFFLFWPIWGPFRQLRFPSTNPKTCVFLLYLILYFKFI